MKPQTQTTLRIKHNIMSTHTSTHTSTHNSIRKFSNEKEFKKNDFTSSTILNVKVKNARLNMKFQDSLKFNFINRTLTKLFDTDNYSEFKGINSNDSIKYILNIAKKNKLSVKIKIELNNKDIVSFKYNYSK